MVAGAAGAVNAAGTHTQNPAYQQPGYQQPYQQPTPAQPQGPQATQVAQGYQPPRQPGYQQPGKQGYQQPGQPASQQPKGGYTPPTGVGGTNSDEPKKSKAWLWVVLGLLLAAGLGVGGYFLYDYLSNKDSDKPSTTTTTSNPTEGNEGDDKIIGVATTDSTTTVEGNPENTDLASTTSPEVAPKVDDTQAKALAEQEKAKQLEQQRIQQQQQQQAEIAKQAQQAQQQQQQQEKASTFYARGQGMFPWASTDRINPGDLQGYTTWQLKIMRNEIYARHGYIFDTQDMKNYFERQGWYRPVSRKVNLTAIEQQNVRVIQQVEQSR